MSRSRAVCLVCKHEFSWISIGSFASVGEVMVQREDGKVFGHMAYFDPNPFDEVDRLFAAVTLPVPNADNLAMMKKVLTRCADPSDGFRWVDGPLICPVCGSCAGAVKGDGPGGLDVREPTYHEYHSLSLLGKCRMIRRMWEEVRAMPVERALQAVRDRIALERRGDIPNLSIDAEDANRYVVSEWHIPDYVKPGQNYHQAGLVEYEVTKGIWQVKRLTPWQLPRNWWRRTE
jgi:hypothetical protein